MYNPGYFVSANEYAAQVRWALRLHRLTMPDLVATMTLVLLAFIAFLLSAIALLLFQVFLVVKSIQVDSVIAVRAALKRKYDQHNSY